MMTPHTVVFNLLFLGLSTLILNILRLHSQLLYSLLSLVLYKEQGAKPTNVR